MAERVKGGQQAADKVNRDINANKPADRRQGGRDTGERAADEMNRIVGDNADGDAGGADGTTNR